ncbi:MAG: NYN domain-containing protein [Candidatus Polarisedimenticolia bacterium]
MVFVDGTNLFRRLESSQLRLVQSLPVMARDFIAGRQLHRVCLYTIQEELDRATPIHGNAITDGVRLRLGTGVPLPDGNVREKGVDALLVSDLIYHAAMKNFDYALLVSADTDFSEAIRRVEDFGCKTGVVGVCCQLPASLRAACDEPFELTKEQMLTGHPQLAVEVQR